MKKLFLILLVSTIPNLLFAQKSEQSFITTDLDNFWLAYDKVMSTKDTVLQEEYIKELYINKGSEGLQRLIESRNYTAKEYLEWITKYPLFWESFKPNTVKLTKYFEEINIDIEKLKAYYPSLKPATIYFLVGAFRTNGMTHEKKILIGSEFSLADKSTNVKEFPAWRQQFYINQNPLSELALLCTHEYIHTQQNALVENLLSMCLYEGVAEFISCKATGKKSASPAIEYGKANQNKVVEKFVEDLFLMSNDYNWLWGENRNEFIVRDLGYYIGYEICERYYNLATDKNKAIQELITLDYTNEKEVERIVNSTKLLPKTLEDLYHEYDKQRPTVISILPFENKSQDVKPGMTKITVVFSEPLLKHNTGIDFGPLGKDYFPSIKPERVFSDDGKSWHFEADLKPNQHYQILISNNFRKENGVRLKAFLIDFKTSE